MTSSVCLERKPLQALHALERRDLAVVLGHVPAQDVRHDEGDRLLADEASLDPWLPRSASDRAAM